VDKESGMHKGEHKREDTKGSAETKKITKTTKVFERSGFKKKKEEFWDYVRQFVVVGLVETAHVETWVKELSWGKIEKLLPKEYKWECQRTKRGKKKRRAAERKFGNFWN
jgi:hypothetical protein